MRISAFGPSCALLALLLINPVHPVAHAANVAQLDRTDPITWLVKSVCTDSRNRVLPVDPYGGCPAGASIRKIRPGDPLPYHNVDQEGVQQRDAFPVFNPIDGNSWIIATFDWKPFDFFNLFDGTDGYDVYSLQDGWVNIVNTSDGGGYGQTFFGFVNNKCTVGDGWVLFPQQDFLDRGHQIFPIRDVYWEQSGQSYPGDCPLDYFSTNQATNQTSWQLKEGYSFGGINGNPVKVMDTLVSIHGFRDTPGFASNGRVEVFYFTREYGITRWEEWTPIEQNPTPTTACNGPAFHTYPHWKVQYPLKFVVQHCRDWSNTTLASTPEIPVWPIPNVNLLAKAHFDDDVGTAWTATAGIKWGVANSTVERDTRYSMTGVRYLFASCRRPFCGGFAGTIYQDVPVDMLKSGTYAFGVSARSEAVPPISGSPTRGTIGVAVEQLDPRGKVLWSDSSTAVVSTDNGTAPSPGEKESVYLSTAFVGKITRIWLYPNTVKLRFLISPQTPNTTFDVLDAWLAPWPVPTAGFGTQCQASECGVDASR